MSLAVSRHGLCAFGAASDATLTLGCLSSPPGGGTTSGSGTSPGGGEWSRPHRLVTLQHPGTGAVRVVRFSPHHVHGGMTLASASSQDSVVLWNAEAALGLSSSSSSSSSSSTGGAAQTQDNNNNNITAAATSSSSSVLGGDSSKTQGDSGQRIALALGAEDDDGGGGGGEDDGGGAMEGSKAGSSSSPFLKKGAVKGGNEGSNGLDGSSAMLATLQMPPALGGVFPAAHASAARHSANDSQFSPAAAAASLQGHPPTSPRFGAKFADAASAMERARCVSDICFSALDENLIAASSSAVAVVLWDIRDPRRPAQITNVLKGWASGAQRVRFNPRRAYLLASAHQGEVRLWDLRQASSTAKSSAAARRAAGGRAGERGSSCIAFMTAHMAPIVDMDWGISHPTEMITYGADTLIKRWDLSSAIGRSSSSSMDGLNRSRGNHRESRQPVAVATLGTMLSRCCLAPVAGDECILTVPVGAETAKAGAAASNSDRGTSALDRPEVNPCLWYWPRHSGHHREGSMRPLRVFSSPASAAPVEFVDWGPTTIFSLHQRGATAMGGSGGAASSGGGAGSGSRSGESGGSVGLYTWSSGDDLLKTWVVDDSVVDSARGNSDSSREQRGQKDNRQSLRGTGDLEPTEAHKKDCQPWPRLCGAAFTVNNKLVVFGSPRILLSAAEGRDSEPSTSAQAIPEEFPRRHSRTYAQFLRALDDVREVAWTTRDTVVPPFVNFQQEAGLFSAVNPMEFWQPRDAPFDDLSRVSMSLTTFCYAVVDVSGLSTVHRAIGEESRLPRLHAADDGAERFQELVEVCRHNCEVAAKWRPERPDLARFWSVLEIVAGRRRGAFVPPHHSGGGGDGNNNPATIQNKASWWHASAVASAFAHYARSGDVELLALASCVLDALGELGVVGGPQAQAARDYHRQAYAELLHRFGLKQRMTELLKWNSRPAVLQHSQHSGGVDGQVSFENVCSKCGSFLVPRATATDAGGGSWMQSACRSCNQQAFRCSVCHLFGRGISVFCLHCGHGGCYKHLRPWFATESALCPTGCGCECKFNFGNLSRDSLIE